MDTVISNGIKINIIGKINRLPSKIKISLKDVVKKTKKNKKIIVNLAINYGSRDEIVNACKKTKGRINVRSLSKNLYTQRLPNPDILIRTGGHKRLSNFMLWQLAYTEIYFIDKLWPDFNSKDFERIIKNFKKVKEILDRYNMKENLKKELYFNFIIITFIFSFINNYLLVTC